MAEIWRDVVGYEEKYQISSCGRVYSKLSKKRLKTVINKNGYEVLATRIGGRKGKGVLFRVHRLVAEAFIKNTESKPFVNHIDGNKVNNDVSNLEWVTSLENTKHAIKIGLFKPVKPCLKSGTQHGKSSIDKIAVWNILYLFKTGLNRREIAKKLNISYGTVKVIVSGKSYKSEIEEYYTTTSLPLDCRIS